MKNLTSTLIVLIVMTMGMFSCQDELVSPEEIAIVDVENSRGPAPVGTVNRKVFISITENVPGTPEVKVYFDKTFSSPVEIRVITTDNQFSEGAGSYFFQPGQTQILRNIEGDVDALCASGAQGQQSRNLTLKIDKIYINGQLSNHPVHIGSASHTLSTVCNDIDNPKKGINGHLEL
ncbi:hypothetical protein [Ekhidna sp.]|uniref:hypothetical protein n=1 Tax=Ekhidna sp. TaxID=2608089 RepID=UPI003298ED10